MLRKALFFFVVLTIIVGGFGIQPAAAQDDGIVCDDATLLLLLIAEIYGYSSNESTILPSVDLSVFDLGENQPYFDALIPALADPDLAPLTDEIVMGELLPAVQEMAAEAEGLTDTENKDVVDEDPACKELRGSVIDYVSAALFYEYVTAME